MYARMYVQCMHVIGTCMYVHKQERMCVCVCAESST